jgi:hypothetical protein
MRVPGSIRSHWSGSGPPEFQGIAARFESRPTIRAVSTATPLVRRVVLGLAGSLVLSALYDAVPNRRSEAEFERLRLPLWFRPVLVIVKGSAASGLLVGLRWSSLGRFVARALVVYFALAIGAHVRVRDEPISYIPAVTMLAWSAGVAWTLPTAQPSPA